MKATATLTWHRRLSLNVTRTAAAPTRDPSGPAGLIPGDRPGERGGARVGSAGRGGARVGIACRWGPRGGRKASDEALIRSLYEEHGRSLLAYATRLTGDRASA